MVGDFHDWAKNEKRAVSLNGQERVSGAFVSQGDCQPAVRRASDNE
jgi:hypothetical protein